MLKKRIIKSIDNYFFYIIMLLSQIKKYKMLKLISLLLIILNVACSSSNNSVYSSADDFQKYLNKNRNLYIGFRDQCQNMYSDSQFGNQYSKDEYCNCIPKAIAFCVYGKEKRTKQEITQSGFKSCIMQGKDTCKSTFKYRKLDIFDKVMLY